MPENELNKKSYEGQKITATPNPGVNIGIDINQDLANNILNAATNSTLDLATLENFLNISQTRENVYKIIDTMGQDSTIASILETYAEDAVETNDQGKVVWAEASDPNILKFITYLLDTMNVDKHIYNWTYSLVKYGDLYLRLYRESDYGDDLLFGNNGDVNKDKKSKSLNEAKMQEDVNLKLHSINDPYVHYLEAVPNPGEMFELTKFGKTMGYIKAPVNVQNIFDNVYQTYMNYKVKRNDVDIYEAGDYVHAALEDNSSRTPERVNIFLKDEDFDKNEAALIYTVKRGQSLLYNVFRIWRELSLLENSILLNRLTKSSIVRVINVEVGDMPKEKVGPHLQNIKSLIEQKSAINSGNSMTEYTNPGPAENNIYIPTHGGIGNITTQQIGGDVDVKQLTDLEYFRDKFFAALRVPKQFFGFTDDAAGFNGGSSLSIISSRYGKAIKRIQNTLIQTITDAVNLMLLDKGLSSYINKFQIRMSAPVTQEEIDKRDNISNKVRVVSDILNLMGDVNNPAIKLKILKSLISSVISDTDVIELLQAEIDDLEKEGNEENNKNKPSTENEDNEGEDIDLDLEDEEPEDSFKDELLGGATGETEETPAEETPTETSTEEPNDEDNYIPSPSELNIDMVSTK